MTKKDTIESLKDLEFNTCYFKLTCDIWYSYTDNIWHIIDKMRKDYNPKWYNPNGWILAFQWLFDWRLDIKIAPNFIQWQFNKFDSFDEISHKTQKILEDLVNFLEIKKIISFWWMHSWLYETENISILTNTATNLPDWINIWSINANYEPKEWEQLKINISSIKWKIQRQNNSELKDISWILFDIDYIILGEKWENSLNTIKNIFSSKENKTLSLIRKIVANE